MRKEWLEEGENEIGSWMAYIGDESVSSEKITVKLHVTDRNVYLEAGLFLEKGAPAKLSNRYKAFTRLDGGIRIPLSDIRDVNITKKFFILKTLNLQFKNGESIAVHFGAMSPQKAHDEIRSRIA
jgi:hypothetical protein